MGFLQKKEVNPTEIGFIQFYIQNVYIENLNSKISWKRFLLTTHIPSFLLWNKVCIQIKAATTIFTCINLNFDYPKN